MSVAVVGSVALDSVETPWGRSDEQLGGAAVYFALAACNYAPVHVVGVVGEDFPKQHLALLREKNIGLEGLEQATGKTFRWSGRYHQDVNIRDTLDTQLNVFESFHPSLPPNARDADLLFLANIHPALQREVRQQAKARFVGLDTMNLWMDTALDELHQALAEVDALIINDAEVRQLTGEANLIKAARQASEFGPRIVVVKKGEHGCLLALSDGTLFAIPAYPLDNVTDPTGAGDSFAGAFMGYLAAQEEVAPQTLKEAVVHGAVVASFTCQTFGAQRLAQVQTQDIAQRFEDLKAMMAF